MPEPMKKCEIEVIKKHPGGRPTKYRPEYCEDLVRFFDRPLTKTVTETIFLKGIPVEREIEVANDFPYLIRWCQDKDISFDTLNEWTRVHPEFSEAFKRAKKLQEMFLVHNTLTGRFNSNFASLVAKNWLGWKDKVEIDEKPKTSHVQLLDSLEEKN